MHVLGHGQVENQVFSYRFSDVTYTITNELTVLWINIMKNAACNS